MCLAIPMQIKSKEGFTAICEAQGVEREVSLFLLQGEPLEVGDHVLIHVGYAIQKITREEADSAWELLQQVVDNSALVADSTTSLPFVPSRLGATDA
jgi:hydrogenase expression/formation protein HypC